MKNMEKVLQQAYETSIQMCSGSVVGLGIGFIFLLPSSDLLYLNYLIGAALVVMGTFRLWSYLFRKFDYLSNNKTDLMDYIAVRFNPVLSFSLSIYIIISPTPALFEPRARLMIQLIGFIVLLISVYSIFYVSKFNPDESLSKC